MFEDSRDLSADDESLPGIAQEVAHHPYAAGMRQLDEQCDIRAVLPQRRMRGMPHAFPTEDTTGRFDLSPREIKGVTMMAYPFRSELPGTAAVTALHQ